MKETIKKHKLDIIIISVILLAALIYLGFVLIFRQEGASVTVTVDNVEIGTYPLNKNATYEIYGLVLDPDGTITKPEGRYSVSKTVTNILVIENGEAFIKSATCNGQQCVKEGKIKYVGQAIICAHHMVNVKVNGNATDGGVDIVT
jgi:hypothetical protein